MTSAVQSGTDYYNPSAGSWTRNLTLGANIGAGHGVLIYASYKCSGTFEGRLKFTSNGSWARLLYRVQDAGATGDVSDLWVIEAAKGGSAVITASGEAGNIAFRWGATEFSKAFAADFNEDFDLGTVDSTVGQTTISTSMIISTAPVRYVDEVAVTICHVRGGTGTGDLNDGTSSGYTNVFIDNTNAGAQGAAGYKILTSLGTAQSSNFGNTSGSLTGMVATIRFVSNRYPRKLNLAPFTDDFSGGSLSPNWSATSTAYSTDFVDNTGITISEASGVGVVTVGANGDNGTHGGGLVTANAVMQMGQDVYVKISQALALVSGTSFGVSIGTATQHIRIRFLGDGTINVLARNGGSNFGPYLPGSVWVAAGYVLFRWTADNFFEIWVSNGDASCVDDIDQLVYRVINQTGLTTAANINLYAGTTATQASPGGPVNFDNLNTGLNTERYFSTQPVNASVDVGAQAVYTAVAAGGPNGSVTYQWQEAPITPYLAVRNTLTVTPALDYTADNQGASNAPFTTTSFSVVAGELLVIVAQIVSSDGGTFTMVNPTNTGGGTLTFSQFADVSVTATWAVKQRAWSTVIGSSGSMTLTFTKPGGDANWGNLRVYAIRFSNYDPTTPVTNVVNDTNLGGVSSGNSNSGAYTKIFPNGLDSDKSYLFSFLYGTNNGTITHAPGTGWTEQADHALFDWDTSAYEYRTGTTTATTTWVNVAEAGSNPADPQCAINFEVVPSPSGALIQSGSIYGHTPGTWADVAGATSSTYTRAVTKAADRGKWVRCVATVDGVPILSEPVRLWLTNRASAGFGKRRGLMMGAQALFTGWAFSHKQWRNDSRNMLYRYSLTDADKSDGIIWNTWEFGGVIDEEHTEDNDTLSATVTTGGVSVTLSYTNTEANDTLSSTATATDTLTASVTEAADTLVSAITAALSLTSTKTEANDTLSATVGLVDVLNFSFTEASDTLSAAIGLIGTLNFSVTEGNDTLAATAVALEALSAAITEAPDLMTSVVIAGLIANLSITEANDTLSALITLGTLVFTFTEAADTVAATVTALDALVLTLTEAADTLSGNIGVGILTASITEAADTLASTAVTIGTLSYTNTEANDTLSATATAAEVLAASITEAADTLAATVGLIDVLVFIATEAPDTMAGTISSPGNLVATVTEAADTLAATMVGVLALVYTNTEVADTMAATVGTFTGLNLILTEASDTLNAAVAAALAVTVSFTEGNDTLSSTSTVFGNITASITEADDSLNALVVIPLTCVLTLTEAPDTLNGLINTGVLDFSFTEAADTLAADTIVTVTLSLAYTEDNDTLAGTAITVETLTGTITEIADTLASTLEGALSMDLSLLEGDDSLTAFLTGLLTLNFTKTEADNTLFGMISTGSGGGTVDPALVAEAVWEHIMANGKTAEENVLEIQAFVANYKGWDEVIENEGNYTAADLLRIVAAVAAGKSTITPDGAGNAEVTFRAVDDSKVRVTAEMTGSERTEVTLDVIE